MSDGENPVPEAQPQPEPEVISDPSPAQQISPPDTSSSNQPEPEAIQTQVQSDPIAQDEPQQGQPPSNDPPQPEPENKQPQASHNQEQSHENSNELKSEHSPQKQSEPVPEPVQEPIKSEPKDLPKDPEPVPTIQTESPTSITTTSQNQQPKPTPVETTSPDTLNKSAESPLVNKETGVNDPLTSKNAPTTSKTSQQLTQQNSLEITKTEEKKEVESPLRSSLNNSTLSSSVLTQSADDEIKHKDILLTGYVFLKYGSWGEPGYRSVNISSDFKTIRWFHHGDTKPSGTMPLDSLLGIKFGRHTPNFKRRPAKQPEQEALSFSIIGEKRNLDLEASLKEQMDFFIEGLVSVMKYLKKKKKEAEEKLKKK